MTAASAVPGSVYTFSYIPPVEFRPEPSLDQPPLTDPDEKPDRSWIESSKKTDRPQFSSKPEETLMSRANKMGARFA